MNTLMRNMVLMCFSAFVLNTAILAHADVGYSTDYLQDGRNRFSIEEVSVSVPSDSTLWDFSNIEHLGESRKIRISDYTYDMLDRLTAAAFVDNDSRSFSSQYQYDLHGNVTNIQRSGVAERIADGASETVSYGVIDNVTLSYSGNRLQVADDAADALVYDGAMDFTDGANEVEEYAYDANGNMTMDLNRGIESITYDWNNMPREITFTSGAITRYTYDAAGRKLRAEYITPLAASANYATRPTPPRPPELPILPPGPPSPPVTISTVCYHGDCVLRDDSLERVLTPNGYIASDTLHYYIKDYQSNVRCVVRHDGAVVESNEYYPYGGLFAATASVQPYKYGAKELDRTHGLDLYDFTICEGVFDTLNDTNKVDTKIILQ